MYSKLKWAVALSFSMISANLIAQGIKFAEGSWEEVKTLAKKEKKPIFVDAYTTWCGPCKKMSKEVFSKPAVGEYFNNNFISYKIDTEKGDGIDFAKDYNVTAFPTLLYFDANGELMSKTVGYLDDEPLINTSKAALDPKNQIANITRSYEESGQSLNDLIIYSSKLSAQGEKQMASDVVNERLNNLKPGEKFTREEWRLINMYVWDIASPVFKSVLENRVKYESIEGVRDKMVSTYIDKVISANGKFRSPRVEADLIRYDSILNSYSAYVDAETYSVMAHYFFYVNGEDDNKRFEASKVFFDNNYKAEKMPYYLAYMANIYVDSTGARFEAADRWSAKSVAMDPADYKNKFVRAQVLYKKGKYNEALTLAEQAASGEKASRDAGMIKKVFRMGELPAFIAEVKAKINP